MEPVQFFGYKKCSTCRNAEKQLVEQGVAYQFLDITQTPPPLKYLKMALQQGFELKQLLNVSGVEYRKLNLKDRLNSLSQNQILELLASNGRLVKRPFVFSKEKLTIGYQSETYKKIWK